MKPFLILQLRPIDSVSDSEFEAFLTYGGLTENDVVRVRMDQGAFPNINLEDYSGIIVGGGPSNVSDPEEKKYDYQTIFEPKLASLIEQVVENDFPFLGACYGFGALTAFQVGGVVGKEQYAEQVSAVDVHLTEDGLNDPLLTGLPNTFKAFVGHKEACQKLPEGAVWLAKGDACPYQMFKLENNVYATQFHPELDAQGIAVRINAYKNLGYFPAQEADALKEELAAATTTVPQEILKRFVEKYKQG